MLLWWLTSWRKTLRKKSGDAAVVAGWLGRTSHRPVISATLLSFVIALTAAAWAGPYLPSGAKREKARGRDVIIALDISKSMLARDIGPDRLTAARAFIADLTQRLETDRIGLLLFAGRAYLQTPLTTDHNALLTMLSTIQPESAPTGGTAIAEAFRIAVLAFPESAPTGRVLVLVSDGEDHGGNALDAAATAVKEGRFTIHTVGIGSPEGAKLFDPKTGSPRTDEAGQPIVSKLDEEGLRRLAAQGGGRYVRMQSAEAAGRAIAAAISPTPTSVGQSEDGSDKEHLFYLALMPAFVLLILETMLPAFRKRAPRVAAIALGFILAFSTDLSAQDRQLRKGNEYYREGRYKDADAAYARALAADSANPRGRFNRGAALYQQKDYSAARTSLNAAATLARDAATKGAALYNTGNTYSAEQKWKDAANAYRSALRARPDDADAQYNLSYATKKLRAQQEQEKQQKQNQSKDKKQGDSQQDEDKGEKNQQSTNAMSKEGAERILSALQEDEKRVRERERDEMNRSSAKPDKDW